MVLCFSGVSAVLSAVINPLRRGSAGDSGQGSGGRGQRAGSHAESISSPAARFAEQNDTPLSQLASHTAPREREQDDRPRCSFRGSHCRNSGGNDGGIR